MKSVISSALLLLSTSAFAGGVIPLTPGGSLPISPGLNGFTVTCNAGAQVTILGCGCEQQPANMFVLHIMKSDGSEKLLSPVEFAFSCENEKTQFGCPQ